MDNLVVDREAGVYRFTEGGKPFCYPSVTEILQLLRRLAGERDADEADLLRGRYVHKAIALLNGGLDGSGLAWDTVDPSLHGYIHAWEKFKAETHFRPTLIETPVRSHQYRYVGTPDCLGTIRDNYSVLLDLKTGISFSVTEGPQLSAYLVAIRESRPDLRLVNRYSLHLHDDGTYKLKEYPHHVEDTSVFLSCLQLYNYLKKKGKGNGS